MLIGIFNKRLLFKKQFYKKLFFDSDIIQPCLRLLLDVGKIIISEID